MKRPNITYIKGFTLIELLIVVAILGVLSAVAVLQYQGYLAQAKVNAVKGNHQAVVSLLGGEFAKCTAGSASAVMGSTTTSCTAATSAFVSAIKTYMDSQDVANPYDLTTKALVVGAAGTTNGATYLTVSGNKVTVTSIADTSNTLTNTLTKE